MAAGIQFVFWGYLSYSALSDYYSATVKGKENLHGPQSLAEKDKVMMEHLETLQSKSSLKWRVTFSLLALSMGAFFGLTALMYPRRMVNRLTFNSKNNMLTISTSTPTGGLRHSEVHRMIIIINKIINKLFECSINFLEDMEQLYTVLCVHLTEMCIYMYQANLTVKIP